MSTPRITVNGDEVPLTGIAAHTTTLDWLRDRGLTGAKEGCAEGECGACSVLVARPGIDTATEWTAVNACLVPVAALDGQEVVTAEGLGRSTDLHPVQQELAVRGGSQCGYCTPGFVCSMAAEYYRPGRGSTGSGNGGGSTDHEHGPNGFDLHALSGNLCRCTGYRPIRDAAYALGLPADDDGLAARRTSPPPAPATTRVVADGAEFVRPADLAEALGLLAGHPEAEVVAGATDYGVEVNLRGARAPYVVAVDRLPELREFEVGDDAVHLGAALTLTEIERLLAGRVPLLDELFPQFASRLIRNGATLGGNLGTASPIGDAPPALLALDAEVVLTSQRGDRRVALADYFTGYRTTVRLPDELIRAVRIPLPQARLTAFHKIAKRRFDDISSVAVGYALDVVDGVVARASLGLGGVAATPLRALATEEALVGRPWTEPTVREAAAVLATEGTPMSDHRASASYRSAMLGQSLLRLHARTAREEAIA
ncbi:xanthine dehydrogenase small subunit [Nocardioides gansuensis]|uniref:Xanthine dehydrogenase small subunit n=1 Tax=Nocardioides gansuensis TaxID=2138300 RepID=A0A2T8FFS1_9ACTN|nr:FAD binding domain-containing protein [Nocardioides gansuensis]PVG84540.1 xanthine dehydrogenase small subunit [Nocardioides gansuensis]